MSKPTQYEIDTCRGVLEYLINEMEEYEPYAVNTINDFNEVLNQIPDACNLEDRDG